jgi:hypothetical protein
VLEARVLAMYIEFVAGNRTIREATDFTKRASMILPFESLTEGISG